MRMRYGPVAGHELKRGIHQLRVAAADLVKFRREEGRVLFPGLDDHVRTIISNGMEHVWNNPGRFHLEIMIV